MDRIIESVGSFGKFQFRISFLAGLVAVFSGALLSATVFIAAEPLFSCKRPNNSTPSLDYEANCAIWSSQKSANHTYNSNSSEAKCYFDKTYYGVRKQIYIYLSF